MSQTKLKFYWNASDDQLKHLRRLAAVTGHQSIRDLFGTLVTEGLKVLEKGLQEEMARLKAAEDPLAQYLAASQAMEAGVKSEAQTSEESNVQCDTAPGKDGPEGDARWPGGTR